MLWLVLLAAQVAVADDKTVSKEQIQQAIRQLGDNQLAVRLQATELLWKAGRAAEPALEAALKSDDLEVVSRAQYVLDRFNLGIFADTPPKIAEAVDEFRAGGAGEKTEALKKLKQLDAGEVLLRLAEIEQDKTVRQQLVDSIWDTRYNTLRTILVSGASERAEKLLERISGMKNDYRDYAAYLAATGKAPARIASLRRELKLKKQPPAGALLALLLRLEGDLPAALEVAQQIDNEDLLRDLLIEAADWKRLSQLGAPKWAGKPAAWLATVNRLAGNTAEVERQLLLLISGVDANDEAAQPALNAWLALDQFDEAFKILDRVEPDKAIYLRAYQSRPSEAWTLAEFDPQKTTARDWLPGFLPRVAEDTGPPLKWEPRKADSTQEDDDIRLRCRMALQIARLLHRLGDKDGAIAIITLLGKATGREDETGQQALYTACRELGLRELALERAAIIISRAPATPPLGTLFRDAEPLARFWWTNLRDHHPQDSLEARFEKLDSLLRPPSPVRSSPVLTAELLRAAEKSLEELDPAKQAEGLEQLAETCLLNNRSPLAGGYFEKAAECSTSAGACLRRAQLLLADGKWPEAAAWYEKAHQRDPSQLGAWYLHGYALEKNGQAEAGQKLIELGQLLALADNRGRYKLATELARAGLKQPAGEQYASMTRLGPCESWEVIESYQQLGDAAVAANEHLKAAQFWDRALLCVLDYTFLEPEGELEFVHSIHRARAIGLVAAGQIDRALAVAELSFAAVPGDVSLAIELVPRLETAGRRDAADELFAKSYTVHESICRDFPASALHHNDLAWLSAKCQRRLTEALEHSKKAVELEPTNANYADTVAETYFQLGDREHALAWTKKSVELDPHNPEFGRQLERLKNGQPRQ